MKILFHSLGYQTTLTRYVGDYGTDLILKKDSKKIVVQAKRYSRDVGIQAVQEIAAALPHYEADEAWIVTNRDFTEAAYNLAKSNNVKLINRTAQREPFTDAAVIHSADTPHPSVRSKNNRRHVDVGGLFTETQTVGTGLPSHFS